MLGSSAYEYRVLVCLLQELSLFFSQPFGATAPGPSGLPGSIFWGFFHQCQPQTVLEDYFYVEMSYGNSCIFLILVPGLFSMAVCHLSPQCMLAVIPLKGGVTDVMATELHLIPSRVSALWLSLPCQSGVCYWNGGPQICFLAIFLICGVRKAGWELSPWERSH